MNLTVLPTLTNVEQLKEYIKSLDSKSPYKWLPKFEKQLVDANLDKRSLVLVGNSDKHDLIKNIENINEQCFYTVSSVVDIKDIPNNYFDIIVWSEQPLEKVLKEINIVQEKLKTGGKIYITNLIKDFKTILDKCLDKSVKLREDYLENIMYILTGLFNDLSVKKIQYGDNSYLLLLKSPYKFIFDKDIAAEISKLDDIILNELPIKKIPDIKWELVKKLIFKMIVDDYVTASDELCQELINKNLINTCEDIEALTNVDYINNVLSKIKLVELNINNNPQKFIDLDITDKKTWLEFIEETAKRINIEPVPPVLLGGLTNIGFTCFMDSILFPILLTPNNYFDKNILNKELIPATLKSCQDPKDLQFLQRELRKIAHILRGEKSTDLTCVSLINIMKKCSKNVKSMLSGKQQDDSEFLIALLDLFKLSPIKIRLDRFVSDDQKEWQQTSSMIESQKLLEVYIENIKNVELLAWYQKTQINNYQNTTIDNWPKDKSGHPRQFSKEKITILESPLLIFHINRKIGGIKLKTPVVFNEYIENVETNKKLELNLVTIHSGSAFSGHYTCYFKYDHQWYYYNDIESTNRVIPVSWQRVFNVGSTMCSLLIYSPLS